MASILITFVGKQDPYSDNSEKEGSIVTLVRYLMGQGISFKKVILLCTQGTQERAEATEDWLETDVKIARSQIEIIPVCSELSDDPVNLLLASREAYRAIETVQQDWVEGDCLEFNASSGTPVMKSSWSILEAAGKTPPNSKVWQVRDPREIKPGQEAVFLNDVSVLKDEFDIQVIKRQIANYNYSGAFVDLKLSNLHSSEIEALLNYGQYRLAFDFDRAFNSIQNLPLPFTETVLPQLAALRRKDKRALLEEIYSKIQIKDKKEEYSDLLVLLFSFQETLLRLLVVQKTLPNEVQASWERNEEKVKNQISTFDGGKLNLFLENYILKNGKKLQTLDDRGQHFSRISLKAILDYQPDSRDSELLPLIESLENYCGQRNDYIHDLKGISKIEKKGEILNALKKILQKIGSSTSDNPFDRLNKELSSLLEVEQKRGQNK
ncbi:hypothetical protein [Oscillatoria sp. FACHB-1406]|uniref:hypothetical protein n=1 Tax=Oscillatoria sp. FACHB-1406 TaxID=2692846 RepID=UPI001686D7FD|nr:hypothetical protein [Oscillatoria sp. FACHB-1406]MBD2576994.1 hypothetical protein [Oscillatoria sp. FACHB-1406]